MILVDVYVPSVDRTYDFMLDEHTEIGKVTQELAEMIGKILKNKSEVKADEFLLYAVDRGELLGRGETLASRGIRDGEKLLLV